FSRVPAPPPNKKVAVPGPSTGHGHDNGHSSSEVLNQAHFQLSGGRTLEGAPLGAELVAFNRHRRALSVAAHHASVDHQLHRTGVVQQNRPVHGELHGHAAGQHVLGAEPHAAARDVDGSAHAGLGDALAEEHLITDFLIDLEATFDPSFPVDLAAERSFFKGIDHQTPPSNRQITTCEPAAQACL